MYSVDVDPKVHGMSACLLADKYSYSIVFCWKPVWWASMQKFWICMEVKFLTTVTKGP